jgi:hypothetical protein
MHHLWRIAELRWYLVELILELAEQPVRRSEFWTTLVSLACVNRDFHQFALNAVWGNLPNLFPILKLMPSVTRIWNDSLVWFPSFQPAGLYHRLHFAI